MRRVRVLVAVLVVVGATCSYGVPVASAVEAPAGSVVAQPGAALSGLVDPLAGLVTNGPIYDMERIGTTTYLGGDFDYIGERTGPVVSLVASTGDRTDILPAVNRSVSSQRVLYAAPPDGDGGWFLAGGFALSGDTTNIGVAHVDAAGQVLWSTPVGGRFNNVRNIEVHDDIILVAGSFNTIGGQTREGLAALDRSTGSVLPWTSTLTQPGCGFEDATLVNGVVYVVGNNCFGSWGAVLRAVNYPSGTVRPFNPLTPGFSDPYQYNVEYFDGLVMTNTYTFDEFSLPGIAPCPIGTHSTRVADVIYTGTETGVVGCDLATGEHVIELPGNRNSAVSADDARVYTATNGGLNAYDRDTAELVWSRQTNGGSSALVIAVSGANVVAADANASSMDVQPRGGLAALDSAGGITSWGPVADGTVRSLAVDGDRIVAGGEFTKIDGITRNRLAGLDPVSGVVDGWDPNANGIVVAVEAADGVVYAGGQFTQVDGATHNRVAAISGSGHPVASWTTGANSTVTALDVFDGHLYVGGVFATMGGVSRSRLAKLDAASGAVTNWNPGADDFIRSIAATGDAVYVGGGFSTAGGQPRLRVAALDPVSGAATSWDPGADGEVWAIAVDAGLVYLGGAFTQVAGEGRASLAAVDTAGGLAAWNPGPTGTVYTIVVDDGVVSAAGLFGTASNLAGPTAGESGVEGTASEDVQAAALPADARSLAFSRYTAPTLPPGTVSGTVMSSGSGSAVGGAWVAVLRTSDFSIAAGAVADGSGNFTAPVPAGSYYLYVVDPSGAHTAGFHGAPATVTVTSGNVTDADPQMVSLRGSLAGTVTETGSGAPVGGAWVIGINASTGATQRGAVADGAGQYDIAGLAAGSYRPVFVDPTGAHASRYFPNSVDFLGATSLAVTAGGSTAADVALPTQSTTPGAQTLSGTVREAGTNAPLAGVFVVALRASDFANAGGAVTNGSGQYSLDVAAGDYKLAFVDSTGLHSMEWHDNQPNTGLATATSVTAPAVTDAALDANTGSMAGTVTDDPSGTPLTGAWVVAIGPTGAIAGGAVTAANGTYTVAGLAPGTYRATIVDPNGGRTQEYYDNSPDYAGATPINITASNTTTINAALAT